MVGRRICFLIIILFGVAIGHPTDTPDDIEFSGSEIGVTFSKDFNDDDILDDEQRAAALEKLQQIFGLPRQNDRHRRHKIAPQFMMELYNTVADESGVTRAKNPYDAKIVRSFIERDSSMAHHYLFNISEMDVNESVLAAELHLYRKKTPLAAIHPSILSSPYYVIRVYQVLDEQRLDTPDLHKLLNVHYVGAHASGWQVFNVKQAVLSWLSGAPNHGLLVTGSNVFGDDVAIHFLRRNDHHHSKQPILVLFNDDGKESPVNDAVTPHYYRYANDLVADSEEEDASYNDQRAEVEEDIDGSSEDTDRRDKITEELANADFRSRSRRARRSALAKESKSIVAKRPKIESAITSMDIYERAMTREKLTMNKSAKRTSEFSRYRKRRSVDKSVDKSVNKSANITECARHALYVDFVEIGWSDFLLAPVGYAAYQCKGHCNFPLSQGQHPTNHATVQSMVHMLRKRDVEPPCCVPKKLLGMSVLYFSGDNVILKKYRDMIVDHCGCH